MQVVAGHQAGLFFTFLSSFVNSFFHAMEIASWRATFVFYFASLPCGQAEGFPARMVHCGELIGEGVSDSPSCVILENLFCCIPWGECPSRGKLLSRIVEIGQRVKTADQVHKKVARCHWAIPFHSLGLHLSGNQEGC